MAIVAVQYELFKPKPTEIEVLRMEVDATHTSLTKVRKGTYAAINENKKRILELEERLSILEKFICTKN